MKKFYVLVICLGFAAVVKSQSELTLLFMHDIFQSSYINPAVIPEHSVSIGLPGISSLSEQAVNNGFLPKNIIDFRNDTAHLVPARLLTDLKAKNLIFSGSSANLFHLKIKIKNGFYWVGIRNNIEISCQYPKELISLALEGNAKYVGRSLDLSNLRVNASAYSEYSVGMTREFNRWIIGGRLSLLQGLANVQFDPSSFNIQIDTAMYDYTFHADARLNTAEIPKNSAGNPSFNNFNRSDITNYLSKFGNIGASLSAGATYKMNDRTDFSFSFCDLGFINWKDNVTSYEFKGQSGFSGIDILSSYLNNTDIKTDTIIDSILDDFERDTIRKPYRTYLNPKFYASVSYDIFRRTTVGFSVSGVYNKKLYPALTLGLSQGAGRYFNLLATVSYNQKTLRNLGVGLVIKPGPFQIYLIADNLYPLINPLYTTNLNFRIGMNLVFGWVKHEEGLPFR